MHSRKITALFAICLVGLLAVLYWPGLHGDFFFDDGGSILLPQGVRLESLSFESIQQALLSGGAGPSGRPVAQLSFALNHYFSGFDPFAFKATNLAIHLACGLLVFALARRLLSASQPQVKQRNLFIASGAVTALWLLHPIQLLPVLHVVQRMTSLSAFFLLAALLLHIRGRERGGRAGAAWIVLAWGIFWPLSFLSKETGALSPLFALTWELIVRRSSSGKLDRFARIFTALSGLFLVAGLAYVLSPRAQWLWAGYDLRPFSLVERVLTEGRVFWIYLGLILAPRLQALGLYHDDIVISTDLLSPWTTLPALFALAGMVWLTWRVRTRAPIVAFGIAWFLIGHALESTVLPLEIAHEHRNYLPLFGVVLLAGWALLQALERQGKYQTLKVAVAGTVLASFTLLTALRAHEFGNELQRALMEAEHHPASSRAQHEAGVALDMLPQAADPHSEIYGMVRGQYEKALALDPNFKLGWLGLIHLNCKAGLPAEQVWAKKLTRRLRDTPFAPGDRNVLYNLKEMAIAGTLCLKRSEVDGLFAAALANPSVSPTVQAMLHSWHADYLWLRERDMIAARNALGQSLALNPANPSNRLKWAQLLLLSGQQEQARHLLLELRAENFSADERQTINELLATFKIQRQ